MGPIPFQKILKALSQGPIQSYFIFVYLQNLVKKLRNIHIPHEFSQNCT